MNFEGQESTPLITKFFYIVSKDKGHLPLREYGIT